MSHNQELLAFQYAMTLQIGKAQTLRPMLHECLPALTKALGCSGVGIWLRKNVKSEFNIVKPVYTYPTMRQNTVARYPNAIRHVAFRFTNSVPPGVEPPAFRMIGPLATEVEDNGHYFYAFPMGDTGIFGLRRQRPLNEPYILALTPIIERLTMACQACMEHEELIKTEVQAVHARQDAEAANQVKTQFLGAVSHELRTPLHAILGLTRLTLDSHLNTEQNANLKAIKSAANGLLSLIDDILDVSNVESEALALHNETFHLKPMLDNLLRGFRFQAEQKHLFFSSVIPTSFNRKVFLDSNRLKQILNILLENALKFTREGGITFEVEEQTNSESNQSDCLFHIQDTGIGVSGVDQEHIFQPFSQADSSYHRNYGGLGVGLPLASKLAQMMGGSITLESEPEKGSRFTLSLPLSNIPADKERDEQTQPTYGAHISILVVEDNPVNRHLICAILKKQGHPFYTAENGAIAVDLWKQHHPDLILMDVQMPVMDGLEATRLIRRAERDSQTHTPIIAVTANVRDEDRRACEQVGMNYFIPKPFKPKELTEAIEKFTSDG